MMSKKTQLVEKFKIRIKEVIKELGIQDLEPNEGEIIKFCKLINDDNPIYQDDSAAIKAGYKGKLIPPGYLMSITNRSISQFFIIIGPEFYQKLATGVIHVYSEVEFFNPMLLNRKYKVKIDLTEPVEKSGNKGSYYSVIFKVSVLDDDDITYAIDNHEFFFKLVDD
jgi:acyl dehydratase